MALVIISVTKRQSTIFQVAQNKGLNPVSSYEMSKASGLGRLSEFNVKCYTLLMYHFNVLFNCFRKQLTEELRLYGNSGGEARQIVVSESPAPNISSLTT
jgi:hypothetical protein